MHLPGHRKKLMREGAQAQAVVTGREGVNLTEGGWSAYKLVLEVHFPDGAQAEVQEKVHVADIGALRGRVGDVLPVRYDPEDRSEVMIDVPAIQAEGDAKRRRLDDEAVAAGRRRLEGQIEPPGDSVTGAQLQGAHEQLVALTDLRRAYDAGEIGHDEYQRRRREIVPDEPG